HVLPPRPTPPTLYTLSLHDALPISLVNLRGQARIDQNRPFRLAQHVDEAGSDDHSVRVESALAGSGGKIPNRRNPSIANAYIARDRKSTRLNSSHVAISYAVFCLKK